QSVTVRVQYARAGTAWAAPKRCRTTTHGPRKRRTFRVTVYLLQRTCRTDMSFARPRSIIRLILLGFAAVAIPLIAAVVTAVVQVDRLAQSGQQAVLSAESAAQQSRALLEHLTEMQRSLGRYYVLGDR